MTKTALIIGTSHSESTCRRNDTTEHLLRKPDRWHDNLENYGYAVTNLSASGCTAAQQFIMIHSYIQDHPDSKWDIVLIEGRSIETAINIPVVYCKGKITENDKGYLYQYWMDHGDKSKKYCPFTRLDHETATHNLPLAMSNMLPWYTEYVYSDLHAIENWSVNRAMCDYLACYATHVKWFTLGMSKEFHKKWESDFRISLGKKLLKDFILCDSWPMLYFDHDPINDLCNCGHYNVSGQIKFWNAIEERLKKENIL